MKEYSFHFKIEYLKEKMKKNLGFGCGYEAKPKHFWVRMYARKYTPL